jgi:hypothetical protein
MLSQADTRLALDIAAGFGELSGIRQASSGCTSGAACFTHLTNALARAATTRLSGLQPRVSASNQDCLRTAGTAYITALQRYRLADAYARRDFFRQAEDQLDQAAHRLDDSEVALARCTGA